jgi:hypothetical protein
MPLANEPQSCFLSAGHSVQQPCNRATDDPSKTPKHSPRPVAAENRNVVVESPPISKAEASQPKPARKMVAAKPSSVLVLGMRGRSSSDSISSSSTKGFVDAGVASPCFEAAGAVVARRAASTKEDHQAYAEAWFARVCSNSSSASPLRSGVRSFRGGDMPPKFGTKAQRRPRGKRFGRFAGGCFAAGRRPRGAALLHAEYARSRWRAAAEQESAAERKDNCSGKGLRLPTGALLRKKGRLRDGLRVQQTTLARYCVTSCYARGTCSSAGPLLIVSI